MIDLFLSHSFFSLLIPFTLMLYLSLFHISFMFFPIFHSLFASICVSIFLTALSSSSPILNFIVSNLLVNKFTEFLISFILFFHCKIYIWFSFIDCKYLVKLSIFSFSLSQYFILFCWAFNHSCFSIVIRTPVSWSHMICCYILVLYFGLSLDKFHLCF